MAHNKEKIWKHERGRVLIAIRENEDRTRMLGYNVFANKLAAVVISGAISGASGAAYALLFGYVGSTFASVQYSILPLLWVLLGGASTTLGPLLGTVLMYYLVDFSSDGKTLLTAGGDGAAVIWQLPRAEWPLPRSD